MCIRDRSDHHHHPHSCDRCWRGRATTEAGQGGEGRAPGVSALLYKGYPECTVPLVRRAAGQVRRPVGAR
eukprot:4096010-Alexandrium_andersonii.AAC.1